MLCNVVGLEMGILARKPIATAKMSALAASVQSIAAWAGLPLGLKNFKSNKDREIIKNADNAKILKIKINANIDNEIAV